MYFHAVKSTAHPPFIGALGHSNDCIVKQSYIFGFMQACCVLLEEELHLQTIKHTYIRKFNVCPSYCVVKVYCKCCQFAQCFYPFKANIETTALQGPDSRKLCEFCI